MSNLRWIERDGKMVLQQWNREKDETEAWTAGWIDVPTHKEPTKDYCGCSVPCKPVKSNRQEKVEELAMVIGSKYDHVNFKAAEAALEWVNRHIPFPAPWHEHYSPDQRACIQIRNEVLSDVRKNLGVE